MPLILNIETTTGVCSVALSRNGELIGLKESDSKNSHSSELAVFIDDILKTEGIDASSLDAVAVSEGPGSYTGLRIGVATAKGICYAKDLPMIGVNTLQAMSMGMHHAPVPAPEGKYSTLLCPMIDARRMEVYYAIFDENGKEIRETCAEIIDENSFMEYLAKNKVVFGGDGALKCRSLLDKHPNAIFLDNFQASAKYMVSLSEEKFKQKKFENLAYFEPFYLKDFVAGKPRVKGLR